MSGGAHVSGSRAGRDIWAVNGTVNVYESINALGGRVLLAPPHVGGDWGLVGRETEIEQVRQMLERLGSSAVVPITGLGGLGKTALAAGYVASHGSQYDLVAWVDASEPDLIPKQYRQIVRNGADADVPEKEAIEAARALLANAKSWLVVFDNASDPDDLQPYLPTGNGQVLVTTRNETWGANPERTFPLGKLSADVVCDWLERALPSPDPDGIRGIATHLDGLPLAIVQAIAYITARPGETAATYLDKLATKAGQRDVLSARKPPGYPEPVATTWQIAVEALQEEQPEANDLLAYLAYVASEAIPVELIDGLLDFPDTPGLVAALRRYGMIRALPTTLSVHRLVQDVTRWSLTEDEERQHVNRWGVHLATGTPDAADARNATWFLGAAPHILSLHGHAHRLGMYSPMLVAAGHFTGMSLNSQRSYATARTILEDNVAVLARVRREGDPRMRSTAPPGLFAESLHSLGQACAGLWEHEDAAKHFQHAVGLFQHAGDHLQAALVLNELGVIERELGEPARAVEMQEDALENLERATGPDSPEVALVLGNLANSYRENGQHDLALRAFERALANFEKAYGPNHRDVAFVLTNLGGLHLDMGDIEQAFKLRTRALEILGDILGPEHPDVAQAMYNLGTVHEVGGDDRGAAALRARALSIMEATRGPDDPMVATARALDEAAHEDGRPSRPRGFLRIPLTPRPRPRLPGNQAEAIAQASQPRLGRNDLCWCGSGLKFKRCHGK